LRNFSDPQRMPLSDEHIRAIFSLIRDETFFQCDLEFARAIEQSHGIHDAKVNGITGTQCRAEECTFTDREPMPGIRVAEQGEGGGNG